MLLWTPKATCTASSLMALWLMCAWWPAMAPSWAHTGADVPTVQGASCALVGCPTKRRARRQGPSLAPLFTTCRVVLAAASRFFRALFTGHWQQAAQRGGGPAPVVLSGLDGDSLRLLLHAIYSRRLPLTAEGAEEEAALLLGAANYLEVRGGSCALSCFCAARSLPYSSHPCCCHTRVSCIPACINSAPALTRRGAPAAPPQVLPVKAAVCEFLRSKLTLQTVASTLALAAANDCLELLEDAVRSGPGRRGRLRQRRWPGHRRWLAFSRMIAAWLCGRRGRPPSTLPCRLCSTAGLQARRHLLDEIIGNADTTWYCFRKFLTGASQRVSFYICLYPLSLRLPRPAVALL